jgi:DnaJ-class molecular chaperone
VFVHFLSPDPNFYSVLGVTAGATSMEIRKAYKAQSLIWHPDKNPSDEAQHMFSIISIANEVLSHPEKRRKYEL